MSTPTIPKCFLGTSFTVDVKGVRVGENLFVSITRLVRCDDSLPGFDKLRGGGKTSQYHQYWIEKVDETYLATQRNIDFGNATGRHGRCGMKPAKLLNKGLRERRIGFEIVKLVRMLQESHDTLAGSRRWPQNNISEESRLTRLIMLTIVAFPATRSRKAICVTSDFSMCPGMS